MNINDLSLGVVEKNNPKALYERMEKCKKEAKDVLKLSSSYRRPVRTKSSVLTWLPQYQMWELQKPEKGFSNWIPTSVAAESLAADLYNGEDWDWHRF